MPPPSYEYVVPPTGSGFDLTELLEHIRQDQQVEPQSVQPDEHPHPLFITMVTLGGVMFALAWWGIVAVAVVAMLLR